MTWLIGPAESLLQLPDDAFRRVKEAAEAVPMLESRFVEFGQGKSSHRSKSRQEHRGTCG